MSAIDDESSDRHAALLIAHQLYRDREPRWCAWDASRRLVDRADDDIEELAQAIGTFLLAWNPRLSSGAQSFSLDAITRGIAASSEARATLAGRSLEGLTSEDCDTYRAAFAGFFNELGPVYASKALALLEPRTFPMWDRRIAAGTGHPIANSDAVARYCDFSREVAEEARLAGGEAAVGEDLLKLLDEEKYCRFTRPGADSEDAPAD